MYTHDVVAIVVWGLILEIVSMIFGSLFAVVFDDGTCC
jgi:hypothetical protein